MTLAAYAAESRRLAEELIGETTESDIEQLRAELASEEQGRWVAWCILNRAEICKLLTAPPVKRRSRKSWRDPRSGPRFRLACIQSALHGAATLDLLETYGLQPGGSYRETAANAGDVFLDLYRLEMYLWPFAGPVPDDWMAVSLDESPFSY